MAQMATAASLPNRPFEYYGEGEPISDVLMSLASNYDVSIRMSPAITGTLNGMIEAPSAANALDYLATAHDLVWYFDGASLHINKIDEMVSDIFRLNLITPAQVKTTLQELNVWDARFDWRSIAGQGIVLVSGPPRYLELVNKAIQLLQNNDSQNFSDPLTVRVFELNHTSAIDRKYDIRDDQIVMPGVATILTNLLSRGGTGSADTAIRMTEDELQDGAANPRQPAQRNRSEEVAIRGASHPNASIQADAGLNAVIVQDYFSRVLLYEQIIETIDQPRKQVEIALTIIDLSASTLSDIGIDWAIAPVEQGEGLMQLVLPGTISDAQESLADRSKDFLAQINLLETEGRARVTSKPAVVTENGIQAVLDNNESFFVKIEGERVAELQEITVGTILEVIPWVNDDETPARIYMDLTIEDGGRLQDAGVESVPSIRNTQISTRTSVLEGGSLLVGGYYRESRNLGSDNLPVLGDIPLMGNLFGRKRNTAQQLVRLFMISPKIIDLHALAVAEDQQLDQPFSFSRQVQLLSDISNENPFVLGIEGMADCENAQESRIKRNQLIARGFIVHSGLCRDIDGDPGFRVRIKHCPERSIEPECRP